MGLCKRNRTLQIKEWWEFRSWTHQQFNALIYGYPAAALEEARAALLIGKTDGNWGRKKIG